MIKLTAAQPQDGYRIALRFSDGSEGVFDCTRFVDAQTPMTQSLRDPAYFNRCFIEAGALAWPNGFDLSARSLHKTLEDAGQLTKNPQAA